MLQLLIGEVAQLSKQRQGVATLEVVERLLAAQADVIAAAAVWEKSSLRTPLACYKHARRMSQVVEKSIARLAPRIC